MSVHKALVVDDSKSARFSLKKILQKMSVGVDFAMSAEEAMSYLNKMTSGDQPDIIFMDHLMPGMDGFQATKAIKENKNWTTIPVVMCTSKEGSEYLKQALSYGAIAILPKPASLKEVSRILDQLGGPPKDKNSQPKPITALYPDISAGMSRDSIEKLAKDTANGVAKHTLEKLVEERLKQFRRELIVECESTAKKTVEDTIIKMSEDLQSDVIRLCKPQLAEIAADTSQAVSSNLVDARFDELSNDITLQVSNQLADIRSETEKPETLDSALLEEVKRLANSTASVRSATVAEQTAADIAEQTAKEIAESYTQNTVDEIRRQIQVPLTEAIGKNQLKSYAMSGLAIAVAVILYFIK
ncbi:MAG: response regulator [Pseudomonadales bacterium]|nr:response regulator [Pseudomonadales bacterium]